MSQHFWEDQPRMFSSQLLDQHFGNRLYPFDILRRFKPLLWEGEYRTPAGYFRPWQRANFQDFGSNITCDEGKYDLYLDVQHFTLKEINVKLSGQNQLIIEGKHHEKQDKHGDVSRHFVRRYVIPEGYNLKKIKCTISKDGILNISIPKKHVPMEETSVKVEQVNEERKEKLKSKL